MVLRIGVNDAEVLVERELFEVNSKVSVGCAKLNRHKPPFQFTLNHNWSFASANFHLPSLLWQVKYNMF